MPKFLNPYRGRVEFIYNDTRIRLMPNQIMELPKALGQSLQLKLVEEVIVEPEKAPELSPEKIEKIDSELQDIKHKIDSEATIIPVFDAKEEDIVKHAEEVIPATPESEKQIIVDVDKDAETLKEALKEDKEDEKEEPEPESKPKKRGKRKSSKTV